MRPLIIALFLLFAVQGAYSQNLAATSDGNDFFIGYVQPSFQKSADTSLKKYFGAYLLVSSYTANTVVISYFDKQTGKEFIDKQYVIPARTGIQIPLDISRMSLQDSGNIAEYAACHVTASNEANVMLYSSGPCSGGSYLAIQTAALGKQYTAASYFDNPGRGAPEKDSLHSTRDTSRGFILIVGTYDGTVLAIKPSVRTLGGHQEGVQYIIQLKKGQCWLVKSEAGDTTADISGTTLYSNKPIAVISGHENAFPGNMTSKNIDGRNYIAQQLIPDNFLDTTGYVALPLANSSEENYRVFCYPTPGTNVRIFGKCTDSAIIYTKTNRETANLSCPLDFEAINGRHFSVVQYQHTAPSIMNIIPLSQWRKSFIWMTPSDSGSTFQENYINIIAQRTDFDSNKITASINVGQVKPILQIMILDTKYNEIPLHPELIGMRFKVSSGSYFVTAPHLFMVYRYGNHGISIDSTVYHYSYASPAAVGMTPIVIYSKVTVHVDTLTSSWLVCAHDSTIGFVGNGINYVLLMDGDNYRYFNCHIDQDTLYQNWLDISPPDTDICFKVSVINQNDSAYAPIYIVDSLGYFVVVKLYYSPKANRVPDTKNKSILFTIQPNPVSGNSLNISFSQVEENSLIIIYDILGREVLQEKIAAGILQTKLSVANLENGIYYAQLVSGSFRTMQKFEILR